MSSYQSTNLKNTSTTFSIISSPTNLIRRSTLSSRVNGERLCSFLYFCSFIYIFLSNTGRFCSYSTSTFLPFYRLASCFFFMSSNAFLTLFVHNYIQQHKYLIFLSEVRISFFKDRVLERCCFVENYANFNHHFAFSWTFRTHRYVLFNVEISTIGHVCHLSHDLQV